MGTDSYLWESHGARIMSLKKVLGGGQQREGLGSGIITR